MNTGSAGYVCLETELVDLEPDFFAAYAVFWAALSDGYGGYACCVEYSLEFLFGAAMLLAPLTVENTRLFIVLEMVQVVFCVENWVPGSSSQGDEADLFEWVEVGAMNRSLRVRRLTTPPMCLTLQVRRAGRVGASTRSVWGLRGVAQHGGAHEGVGLCGRGF